MNLFQGQFVPKIKAHISSKNLPLKALLIINSAKRHYAVGREYYKFVIVIPNMTPYMQTFDQYMIKSLKVFANYTVVRILGN